MQPQTEHTLLYGGNSEWNELASESVEEIISRAADNLAAQMVTAADTEQFTENFLSYLAAVSEEESWCMRARVIFFVQMTECSLANHYGAPLNYGPGEAEFLAQAMDSTLSLDSVVNAARERLTTLREKVREKSYAKSFHLASCIQQFILDNLSDCNLSNQFIAEHFGLSVSKVTSTFKQEFHCGMTSYIQTQRIELVRKLLLRDNLTVNEIAQRVGFSSVSTMYRTFHKYENSSPCQFRCVYKASENES